MRLAYLSLLLCSFLFSPAGAITPTAADDAIRDHSHIYRPVWISDDGAWRLSQNAAGELLREAMQDGAPSHRVALGDFVGALASHGDGMQVWLLRDACLYLLDLRKLPQALPLKPRNPQGRLGDCRPMPPAAGDQTALKVLRVAEKLHLSASGALLAQQSQQNYVTVSEAGSGKLLRKLPAEHIVLALQFEQGERVLRIVSAGLQQEDDKAPAMWRLNSARWDLRSGALLQFAQQQLALDFGALQVSQNRRHLVWHHPAGGIAMLDMHSCPLRTHRLAVPHGDVLGFTSDPQGGWLAVLSKSAKRKQADLHWLHGATGALLASSTLPLPAPQPESNPRLEGMQAALYGHAGGLLWRPQALSWDTPETLLPWRQVALPKAVAAAAAAAAHSSTMAPSAQQLCLLPGESAQARQPRQLNAPPPLWSLPLSARNAWSAARNSACLDWPQQEGGTEGPGGHYWQRWGVGPDGRLWLDQGDSLHWLDAASGKTLALWPTPRQGKLCSTPSFARAAFLNWQGDSLSLRPFAAQQESRARQVITQRPGWQVLRAQWLGDKALAYWRQAEKLQLCLYQQDAMGRWRQSIVEEREVDAGLTPRAMLDEFGEVALPHTRASLRRQQAGLPEPAPDSAQWRPGPFRTVQLIQGQRLLLWHGLDDAPARVSLDLLELGHGRAMDLENQFLYIQQDTNISVMQLRTAAAAHWRHAAWAPQQQVLLLEKQEHGERQAQYLQGYSLAADEAGGKPGK
ncbi:hypothetical protein V8J88_09610 [Massilia sp. W12]|uniref:hypothetical protein n=1 Tax=Massilia sp. W12 TaxID=3126507 RepID=UPI0030D27A68